jgi:glutathione S-transferase
VLTVHALSSGICEAAVSCRYERALRPEALRWPEWVTGQMKKIESGLDWLEGNIRVLGEAGGANVDLAQITVGCALGYLDFRFADVKWRETRPGLAAWAGEFTKRDSMRRTMPAA